MKPPITQPYQPTVTFNDVQKGTRLSIKDVSDILSGAYPGTLFTDNAADGIAMPVVPSNTFRIVQWATADGTTTAWLAIIVNRQAVDYVLAEGRIINGVPSATVAEFFKGIVLKPGDEIRVIDYNATGQPVYLYVSYIDVFI